MSMIDDIKRDRGCTTDFRWIGEVLMANEHGEVIEICACRWSSLDEFKEEHKRRIARIADMEAALIAAEELARLADLMESELGCDDAGCMCESVRNALAAYRKATGVDQ